MQEGKEQHKRDHPPHARPRPRPRLPLCSPKFPNPPQTSHLTPRPPCPFLPRGNRGGPRPAESLLDRFLSLVDLITVHKPLTGLPAGVSARCAEPLAEAFVVDPGDDTPFSILAFPKAGLALGLEMERYPHVDWTSPKTDDGTTQRATMAIKDVEKGRLGSAVRRLGLRGQQRWPQWTTRYHSSPEQAHLVGAADPFAPPRAESLVTSHLRKRSRPP